MTRLTTESDYLVELSEDQQEVVSGGGGKHGCYPHHKSYHKTDYDHKKKRCHRSKKHYPW